VPALWLASRDRRVRAAALVAMALGAIRLAVPALMYLAQGAEVRIFYGMMWLPTPSSTLVSLGLWIISLCAMAGFLGLSLGRRPSRAAAAAAPTG
jgi:hypothetical protein